MQEQTVSVLQAAAMLEVSRDTIHRLIKSGNLKAHKKTFAPHSAYQVHVDSINEYDARRRAETAPAR